MFKRSQLYPALMIVIILLSCSRQQGKSNVELNQKDSALHEVLFMKNLGEPTGPEIKTFDFYLVFTHLRQYHALSIYSMRFKKNSGAMFYRVIDPKYPAVLQNEYQLDTAVMFKSYYKALREPQLQEVRKSVTTFDLEHLSDRVDKKNVILSEGEYQLLIYNEGKLLSIIRSDTLDTNLQNFIRNLKEKHFSSFPAE